MGCSHSKQKEKTKNDNQIDQDKIDQAILDLKVTRDKLKQYQKQQERCQEIELEKARELVKKGQKDRARIVLRQKKAREIYINNAEHMLEGIDSQINNIQTKQMEINMIENIKQTNSLLKKMNDLMPIEEVERIMDENQEQNDRLNEISSLLAQDMNPEINEAAEEDLDKLYEELDVGEPNANGQESGEASEESPAPAKTKPQKMAMPA